jgi:uncharacterized SAM-binding protein YcdF (DUF218 family)
LPDQVLTERSIQSKPVFGPRTCLLVLLAILSILYLGLRGMGAFLITGDSLKKADVVVPLGGGGEWRVVEAVHLIEKRYAVSLVLTEPGETTPGEGPGSRFFRSVAIENGLSANAIEVTEGVQRSTEDEAQAVLKLMQKHQYKSVIVVTDPFHTQRARLIFRDVFRGSGLSVRVHPVSDHWYRSSTWFLSADGWANTLREYIKLAGYVLRKQGCLAALFVFSTRNEGVIPRG